MQSKLLRGFGTRTRLHRLALPCLIIIHKLIVASCDCLKHTRSAFLFFSRWARKPVFFKKQYAALEESWWEGGPRAFQHVSVATQTDLSSRWDHRKWRENGPECCESTDSSARQPAGSWPQTPHPTDSQYMPFVFRYISGKMLPVRCWTLLRK